MVCDHKVFIFEFVVVVVVVVAIKAPSAVMFARETHVSYPQLYKQKHGVLLIN